MPLALGRGAADHRSPSEKRALPQVRNLAIGIGCRLKFVCFARTPKRSVPVLGTATVRWGRVAAFIGGAVQDGHGDR